MKKIDRSKDRDEFRRILSLAIMLFSGIGFKILQFNASLLVWMVLLLIINIKSVVKIPATALLKTIAFLVLLFLMFFIKNAVFPYFVIAAIFSALIVLSNYLFKPAMFLSDFSKLLQFYMYYALLAIPIMLFATNLCNNVLLDYSEYRTFYYLFWFVPHSGPNIFSGFRPIGFTWEPGIWQLFLNLNLLLALYENRPMKKIFLALIASITVFSTTGIILMGFVLFMHLVIINKIKVTKMIIPFLVILIFLPLLSENINEKISGKYFGSGMTRVADFFTGITLLIENPILGADKELATASTNDLVWNVKQRFWSGNFTDGGFENFMTVANSNGIVIFLLDWGIPIAFYLLYRTLQSNLFFDKKLNIAFMLTIFIAMFAEAISRTSFFYFFILASFLLPSNKCLSYEK